MNPFVPLNTCFLKYNHPVNKNNCENDLNEENDSLQKVLDSMFSPRITQGEDFTWEERVSTVPATRSDSLSLAESLDSALQEHQARETGICPIRRHLYDQCFDELIRQVTINCIDQGLLFYRIRNEIRMTMDAMQHVYDSGIAFGMRTSINSKRNDMQLENTCLRLQEENSDLRVKLDKMQKDLNSMIDDKSETYDKLVKHYNEEIVKLERVVHQQKMLIESLKRKPVKF